MTQDVSMRAFKCPSCGAPLEPEAGTLTMKCPYCSGTVIIPESMRTPAPSSSGPSVGEVFQFGLNGVDLNQIMGNAMHLPQAISLAQQGKIDEAADLYSKITGMDQADAVNAVKDMASGRAVSLTPGIPGTSWKEYKASFSQPSVDVSTPSVMSVRTSGTSPTSAASSAGTSKKGGARSCGILLVIIVAVVALITVLVVGAFFLFSNSKGAGALIPLGFASQTLSFGSEGIGSGMHEDARSVGVDGSGNIIVADYQDGRVQTFDPSGKLVSAFSLSSGNQKV
jgi:DNA-directed RNA polymerase subunit RPC12/RpoP